MPSPAWPGMFFAFVAVVLLIFASVSPPVWDKVYFLKATVGGTETVYGVFGECIKGGACTAHHVGYDLTLNGATNVNINPSGLHNLTYALILHPIAGGVALLALLMGLLGVWAASRIATIFMAVFSFIASVICLVVFVIDMVLWNLVRTRIRDAGHDAMLGNANWFTLGAFVALVLSFCASFCGAFGRFATGRSAGEKY